MTSPYTPTLPDLTNDPTVFPLLPGENFKALKSPQWSTKVATSSAGPERRRQLWSYPKWRFKITHEVARLTASYPELQRLFGFFNYHAGMFAPFNYYDASDNLVTDTQFGTGDGVTTSFQLSRIGGTGAMTWVEPVQALVATPKVSVGVTNVTAFTISGGQITFSSAPAAAAALTWSGQFMFRVRFEQDSLDATELMQTLWSQSGLQMISDKR